jgi:uncharacterized protein YgfB (UPF0149 family)
MTDSISKFSRIEQALASYDPTEIHGILCGMLCINNTMDGKTWLNQISDILSGTPTAQAEDYLLDLFSVTVSQLDDDSLGFFLLLPPDEITSLSCRTEALGNWCQGFMAGLGLAGMSKHQNLPAEIREFLTDLTEISKVDFNLDETENAASEEAYMEIVEYVRMGVLLVHQIFRSQSPSGTPSLLH